MISENQQTNAPAPIVDVHVLLHGFALCRFDARIPREWPDGHVWVGLEEHALATCVSCRQIAAEAKQ